MLREAKILVPWTDNSGQSLGTLHSTVADALAGAFGGVTETTGKGIWRNPVTFEVHREPVAIFLVATEDTEEANDKLTDIARTVAYRGEQEAVYVAYPSGRVVIWSKDALTDWYAARRVPLRVVAG